MAGAFVLDDQVHFSGDPRCPACGSEYPQACRCGGLMHGAHAAESATGPEVLGAIEGESEVLSTLCDACGRSEDELAEETA